MFNFTRISSLPQKVLTDGTIPNEDIEVYLTAKLGNSDCFVSSNRKLIKAIATFECLTPREFINHRTYALTKIQKYGLASLVYFDTISALPERDRAINSLSGVALENAQNNVTSLMHANANLYSA